MAGRRRIENSTRSTEPGGRAVDVLSDVPVPAATLSAARNWHERAVAEGRTWQSTGLTFDYLGLSLVVPPDVQPITPVSRLLGEAVVAEADPADLVLNMGTGSGVNALLSADRGAAVVAVDVNPSAVAAAVDNAERNGAGCPRRRARERRALGGDRAFDLIVFDPGVVTPRLTPHAANWSTGR